MTINDAVEAIDKFLERYAGSGGLRPVEKRVLPSAEDADVIKVWIDLGDYADEGTGDGADAKAGQAPQKPKKAHKR